MVGSAIKKLQGLPEVERLLQPDSKLVHLLVVDDDQTILKLCERHLRHAPLLAKEKRAVEVHCAESGERAVEVVQRLLEGGHNVACALVDVRLPGGANGVETMRRLWELDSSIQCTLMTGGGQELERQIEEQVPPAFMDRWDYMAKPFTEFQVVHRMRRSLSNWLTLRLEEKRRGENLKLVLQLASLNRELEDLVGEARASGEEE